MNAIETKIEKDISGSAIVYVWNLGKGWMSVSKHLYMNDAEIISESIRNGEKRNEIKELVNNMDSRCNNLLLRYNENW